jgi:hypothetical protein
MRASVRSTLTMADAVLALLVEGEEDALKAVQSKYALIHKQRKAK